jgi:UDP-GlcNAc3NAcA epimerase
MKVLTVIGARPQFIKASVVSREFSFHENVSEIVIHTGQHYDPGMSEIFFREMNIAVPKYNLGIKSSLQGEMTGRMIEGIEKIILEEKPDALLVYGDTNSTIAGALAASKLHLPVIHIEAGLRSFNMNMPEEINRIVTDRLSSLLFCPTEIALENLKKEGFDKFRCRMVKSGDVMLDAALHYSFVIKNRPMIKAAENVKEFILCTIHRAENTNDPERLKNIISAINKINKEVAVIFPLHPRTKKTMEALGLKSECILTEPLGYLDILNLLKHCSMVITDSGGLQKESYFSRKSCLCVRDESEWKELVDSGHVVLSGTDENNIIETYRKLKNSNPDFSEKFYGDGKASEVIVREILKM